MPARYPPFGPLFKYLLFDARRSFYEVLVRRIASGSAVEANSVRVPSIGFSGQQAVDLSLRVQAQLVAELCSRAEAKRESLTAQWRDSGKNPPPAHTPAPRPLPWPGHRGRRG